MSAFFKLVKHGSKDIGWTDISYEVPFDSNAGRMLFRTGFLLELATLKDYEDWNVIQKGKGKGGLHYIRVTNIRGRKVKNVPRIPELFSDYADVVTNYLKIGYRPKSMLKLGHCYNYFTVWMVHSIPDVVPAHNRGFPASPRPSENLKRARIKKKSCLVWVGINPKHMPEELNLPRWDRWLIPLPPHLPQHLQELRPLPLLHQPSP